MRDNLAVGCHDLAVFPVGCYDLVVYRGGMRRSDSISQWAGPSHRSVFFAFSLASDASLRPEDGVVG